MQSKTFDTVYSYEWDKLMDEANRWASENGLEIVNVNKYQEKHNSGRPRYDNYKVYYLTAYGKPKMQPLVFSEHKVNQEAIDKLRRDYMESMLVKEKIISKLMKENEQLKEQLKVMLTTTIPNDVIFHE
jgi:hypothetical protein